MAADSFEYPSLGRRLSPETRICIAKAYSDGMRGRISAALSSLAFNPSQHSSDDAVARHLCCAHLLHLDRRTSESIAIFDKEILPAACALPEEIRLILEQNRVDVAWGGGLPGHEDLSRHYALVDRRKLFGVHVQDADALLAAAEASSKGENYKSLPVYASSLFDAYGRCDWRAARRAAGYLARESLRLNAPAQASFYAILSEDNGAYDAVATYLRATNDADIVEQAIGVITDVSHLGRHVIAASKLLVKLGDAVPDVRVEPWLERLRPYRSLTAKRLPDEWIWNPAWEATAALLDGASPEQADIIIGEILDHPRWKLNAASRHQLFGPLEAAARACSEGGCRRIIDALVPLVTVERPDHDFDQAIGVLYSVTEHWPALKSIVVERIYSGKEELSVLLVRTAPAFDVVTKVNEPEVLVQGVIGRLRRQVEHLPATGESSHGLGEVMIQTKDEPDGRLVVRIGSSRDELIALAANRKNFTPELIWQLLQAVLELIREPDNVNQNRIILLDVLRMFADVMDDRMARGVCDALKEFGADHRATRHPLHGQAERYSGVERFRMGTGWPQEVRGAALRTIAQVNQHHPSVAGHTFSELFSVAVADPLAAVRRDAYHAAHIAGSLSQDSLPAIVSGTRDADPVAANVALQICGFHARAIIDNGFLPFVLGAIGIQYRHEDVEMRKAAAIAASKLKSAVGMSPDSTVQRLVAVVDHLKMDVSRRVRRSANGLDS